MDTLTSFDTEEEITEFVCCKIQSIIANNIPDCQFADGKLLWEIDQKIKFLYSIIEVYVIHRRRSRII